MAYRWHGNKIRQDIINAIEHGLDRLANSIVKTAQQSMREPKHGIHYPGMPARSSAPGEAPAAQHAAAGLLGSVQFVQTGPLTRRVGTNLWYGRELEFGRRKMAPRPWLRPAYYKFFGQKSAILFTAGRR